jgi:hypothetical protein
MKRIALAALAVMFTVGSFAGGSKHAAKKECTKCEKAQCTPACNQDGCCHKS